MEAVIPLLLKAGRAKLLATMVVLIGLTAFANWALGKGVSLAPVYILPMIVGAVVMRPYEIALGAVLCSWLRSMFELPGTPADGVIRFVFAVLAYMASGFFVVGLVRNHVLVVEHLDEIRREQNKRVEAEEQLRLLAESSPAAILTVGASGAIIAANRAAENLFLVKEGASLNGEPIQRYMPILAEALALDLGDSGLRTAAQTQGRRGNGEIFFAHTWFSTYAANGGTQLAAIVVDTSEEMRDREEQGLRQLLHSNRIAAAAVAHEVRNFCGAMSLLCSNLDAHVEPGGQGDLHRLASLVSGLESIAALDLQARTHDLGEEVPLRTVLDNLRIVIAPAWEEIGGHIEWALPATLPTVLAEPHGLLQAFLNVAHNSRRAVHASEERSLRVEVSEEGGAVFIRFIDSGPGIPREANLFEALHPGAEGSGLGLYVSRSIIRGYGGDLRHEPGRPGCCFTFELQGVNHAA